MNELTILIICFLFVGFIVYIGLFPVKCLKCNCTCLTGHYYGGASWEECPICGETCSQIGNLKIRIVKLFKRNGPIKDRDFIL